MPDPLIVYHVLLGVTLLFLLVSFFQKNFFVCAYLLIVINRPGLYYPVLEQFRFELIVAIWAMLLIIFSGQASALLSVQRHKIVRYMFYFFAVIVLSMLQAFDLVQSWEWIYKQVFPSILIALLMLVYCRNKRDLNFLLWVYSITMASLGYEAVFRYLAGDVTDILNTGIGGFQFATAEQGRASGHTSLANYLLYAMPFLWYLGCASQKMFAKLAGFGIFSFCFAGVLISGARGGLVGLILLFIFITLFSDKKAIVISLGVAALFLSIPLMGDKYLNRMSTITDLGGSDLSAHSRLSGLIHGIEMMIKRPILGVGPGCYPLARKAWMGWSLWAHNLYGQLAGELGVIGCIVWFRFFQQYLKRCQEIRKIPLCDPWLKTMSTAILVSSFVSLGLGMFSHSLYSFIWIIMASSAIIIDELSVQASPSAVPSS